MQEYIDSSKIVLRPGRGRKKFEQILELAESIKDNGLIQPIVLNIEPDGTYVLVAGERRFRAMMSIMGLWNDSDEKRYPPDAECRKIKEGLFPYVLKENLSSIKQKEIELEENLRRAKLEWPEESELLRQIDELKKSQNKDWTFEKTAAIVDQVPQGVGQKIRMAEKIQANPKLKEELRHMPLAAAIKVLKHREAADRAQRLQQTGEIAVHTDVLHGSCVDLASTLTRGSVGLWLTDSPFAISDINESSGQGSNQSYRARLRPTDNCTVEQITPIFRALAPKMFDAMKPGAYFFIFFGWDVLDVLKASLRDSGFEVNSVPIIWNKMRTTDGFKGYEPAPCYEPILFGIKPPRSRRLNEACKMIFDCKPLNSDDKLHPFQKPLDLLQTLIKLSTNHGELVVDTFCGSGSTIVAAKSLGRSGIGFEIDEANYRLAQLNLTQTEETKK